MKRVISLTIANALAWGTFTTSDKRYGLQPSKTNDENTSHALCTSDASRRSHAHPVLDQLIENSTPAWRRA